jgi:type II secretory pathway pseudopilin PulG
MRKLGSRGFTMVEAIASVFIVALLLTTALTIILNLRNQTTATNERILAVEVGTQIRDDLINGVTYSQMETWMNGLPVDVTSSTCPMSSAPFSCNLFAFVSDGQVYDDNVTLHFDAPTTQSAQYQVIHFTITIVYFKNRSVDLTGIIYE